MLTPASVPQLAASIITQVSPTGTTAQPARPAKSARAPKAKRKKDSAAGEGATGVAGDEDEGEQSVSGEEATDSASAEKLAAGEGEKPSTTTAVSTADPSPTPSATIVESTSPPTTTTPQPRSTPALQTKKKKRGPFASFFAACIPCLSPSDTFTDPPPSTTATKVVPTTTTGNGTASPVLSEKSPTPPLDDELLIPANPQDETDAGVVLSQEETEGVTSGAVMPPGKGRRRKSGRAPEGIITSVPEPGQRREESSEESQDESEGSEEDEEQGLIARGGVGIPIGEVSRRALLLGLDEELMSCVPRTDSLTRYWTRSRQSSRGASVSCWISTRRSCIVLSRCALALLSVVGVLTPLSLAANGSPGRLRRSRRD